MLSRRDLLASAAAAGAASLAAPVFAEPPVVPGSGAEVTPLNTLFAAFMQERLVTHPELATGLGLDKSGPLAAGKHTLSDASQAGVAADKAMSASQLARLQAFDATGLTGIARTNYEAVLFSLRTTVAADRQFDFGEPGARSPYVLSQLTGDYQSTPTFLDTQHRIESADDAQAYLDRLQAFGRVLDEQTERARHDEGLGVVPPDFILDKALEQMKALQRGGDTSILVTSIVRRTKDKAIPGDWDARATAIVTRTVQPALQRQMDQVREMRGRATSVPGIGSRPQGMDYYAAGLLNYTTSSFTPQEVHRIGLEQTKQYQDRIDTILRAQGMTQGSVGARLTALSTDPKFIWPDTDAGKDQMIGHLNDLVHQITPRLPRFFNHPPNVPLEIRRVPPYIEAGAPLGYYNSASLDGSRPAIYYINLAHTADWPRWLVSSVTFHEGVPGHHLQISTAQHIPGQPLIRKIGNNSGYAEGWALYAEQLADEIGMYDADPLGRVGYLKSELWRACRMVLDTGIHTMGWTRDQAIQWKMDNDGSLRSGAANEVERYCVWPGQAPSYKIGHTVINQLRDQARASLGPRFDIKTFHDVVLNSGAVPLEVLKGMGAKYAATGVA